MKSVIKAIRFSSEALYIFQSEIAKYGTIEAGGVLLGNIQEGIIEIAKATDGGLNAIHEQCYFQADPNYIDMEIDMAYGNSGGKVKYLGEWHTHPQVNPRPSPKDLISLEEIADTSEDFAVLVIIGAVGFKPERLYDQVIALLKFRGNENFYELRIEN